MESIVKKEERILQYWDQNKIFEKSIIQNKKNKIFSFYDGPPFATGLPHYGTLLPSFIKDTVLRYQTMQGLSTKREWGWDCHGLPIENLIEKKLKIKSKKEIEEIGVKKFNQACKDNILSCKEEWKDFIKRIGRWVDMEKDYKTMNIDYMESVWWGFKQLWDKKLIYQGYKSMHICPRCETTLSNFEISLGYKETQDISIIVKFKIRDKKNNFFLAWTTTAWTLPGNTALAIDPDLFYCKIKIKDTKSQIDEYLILAKDRLKIISQEYTIIEEFKGNKLINLFYEPLFDYYYNDKSIKNKKNGWKIYPAEFIKSNEGTGIVHIAPAFGEEDMLLGQKHNLPFIQHIEENGCFKKEIKNWAGEQVKPQENHLKTDQKIIAWLNKNNQLFSQEKIKHRYPFCWRCNTPLLNYATSSWFIQVTKIKSALIKNNQQINWLPKHLKYGRFEKWLTEVKDWAISRSRFWGTPLPIWKCQKCENITVIGSKKDLLKQKFSTNQYHILRHGQTIYQTKKRDIIYPCFGNDSVELTKQGEAQIEKVAKILKKEKIDLIFSSDFLRTKQTANIIAQKLKLKIVFDKRLRDVNLGVWHGKSKKEFYQVFPRTEEKRFYERPLEGESWLDCKKRILNFINEINQKYQNKKILIISHGDVLWLLEGAMKGLENKQYFHLPIIKVGEIKKLNFKNLPYNERGELDFHRPYIDKIKFKCSKCNQEMERITEVFDCWFESGSMPFAHIHYPFENKKNFEENFPADFIAEGLDQTRGWFYSLLVLSTALFNKPSFKNVIVNGLVLAEDGRKMSKSLKNYPEPMEVINKYGSDALRYYLLSSPLVSAKPLKLSIQKIDQVVKKNILILLNVCQFYQTYSSDNLQTPLQIQEKEFSKNLLDQWIISKLHSLVKEITQTMNNYKVMQASKPIQIFINDLSTWYLRRSRKRLKQKNSLDKQEAEKTLFYVLKKLSIIIAPFMPFLAESVYLNLKNRHKQNFKDFKESVHLEKWSEINNNLINKNLEQEMEEIKKIISQALAQRKQANIKVRQPIASLKIKNQKSKIKNKELLELIKQEVNVKKIIFDSGIKKELEIDTKITPKLKKQGYVREITRIIQKLRKQQGLTPKDRIIIQLLTNNKEIKEIIKQEEKYLKEVTLADKLIFILDNSPPPNYSEIKQFSNQAKKVQIEEKTIYLKTQKQ